MTDRGSLAAPIALREHDIIDPRRIDFCALDQRFQNDGAELTGADAGKATPELADRGTNGGDNGCATQSHGTFSLFAAHVLIGKPVPTFPDMHFSLRMSLIGKPVPTFPGHALGNADDAGVDEAGDLTSGKRQA